MQFSPFRLFVLNENKKCDFKINMTYTHIHIAHGYLCEQNKLCTYIHVYVTHLKLVTQFVKKTHVYYFVQQLNVNKRKLIEMMG